MIRMVDIVTIAIMYIIIIKHGVIKSVILDFTLQ